MTSMNIFKNDAFSMTSLTGTIEKIDYVPQTLGQLAIFEALPTRTRNIFVERREGKLTLIPSSALGAPPEELVRDDRDLVPLQTTRLAKGFTLYASEIDGIRAHGSQTELMQVQAEYLRRAARIRNDMDMTHEYHRLGALQGLLLDADGTTVIYDYFAEFGVVPAAPINFKFSVTTTDIRRVIVAMTRDLVRKSGGVVTGVAEIHALAGDNFYDTLISHPMVERTYLNWAAAQDLNGNSGMGAAFSSFKYGGVTWHNYRGTDDNSTVAVDTDEAIFFPVGARDVFKKAMAPAEFGPYIGTPGQDTYLMNILDRDRMAWTRGELYSYPLYLCQRPDVLRKGIMS